MIGRPPRSALGRSAAASEVYKGQGLNRVRFPTPVHAGSRVRGHFTLRAYDPLPGGAQLTVESVVELEGSDKPACVAESVSRRYV